MNRPEYPPFHYADKLASVEREAMSLSSDTPFTYLSLLQQAAPYLSLTVSNHHSGVVVSPTTMDRISPVGPTAVSNKFAPSSHTNSHTSSDFTIKSLLDSSPGPDPVTSLLPANRSVAFPRFSASPLLPLSLPQRHALDTAKLFWLQQFAQTNFTNPASAAHPLVGEPMRATKKRKLGRNPRIPFTQQQIDCLERKYTESRYLSSMDVVGLSKQLDLSEARVKIWFQNRRARERRDKRGGVESVTPSGTSPLPTALSSPTFCSATPASI